MDPEKQVTITVETTIKAPIEVVWSYWTDPKHITKWYYASDNWYSPDAANDFRVNGKFKTTMAAKDGSMSFDFDGTYTRILEYKVIEYTIMDGRKVKVSFTDMNNKTEVLETFEPEKVNPNEMQKNGWQAILDNFKKYTEANRGQVR